MSGSIYEALGVEHIHEGSDGLGRSTRNPAGRMPTSSSGRMP